MERFKVNTRVLVRDGYMDCQCRVEGELATVIGYAGERVLIRDRSGHSEYVSPESLQVLPQEVSARPE
ncbi:hypothetical protein [Motiliproteus sediminis]|uniref:hypothetical protein n=1 Tax=Motiliproteus sediminis TaxID=1468178 RepID=UPI001AEFE831|nr:hypothetical protein [Motiliproteus sediminis]